MVKKRTRIGWPPDKPQCTTGFLVHPHGARQVPAMVERNRSVDFGGVPFELPHTPWLRLEDAVRFALQGKTLEDHEAYERAFSELERRLSKAAFEGIVRFRGVAPRRRFARCHERSTSAYFAEPRGLVTSNNEIHAYPYDGWHEAIEHNQIDPDWRGVVVERAGFAAWLAATSARCAARSPCRSSRNRDAGAAWRIKS